MMMTLAEPLPIDLRRRVRAYVVPAGDAVRWPARKAYEHVRALLGLAEPPIGLAPLAGMPAEVYAPQALPPVEGLPAGAYLLDFERTADRTGFIVRLCHAGFAPLSEGEAAPVDAPRVGRPRPAPSLADAVPAAGRLLVRLEGKVGPHLVGVVVRAGPGTQHPPGRRLAVDAAAPSDKGHALIREADVAGWLPGEEG